MDLIDVTQEKDTKFTIAVRGHRIQADMNKEDGGEDVGPNPIELLCGALGACIGMTISLYCKMHQIPSEGIEVNVVPTLEANPKGLNNVAVDINLPKDFPEDKKEIILRVAEKCPVHKALRTSPKIDIELV